MGGRAGERQPRQDHFCGYLVKHGRWDTVPAVRVLSDGPAGFAIAIARSGLESLYYEKP